MKVYQGKGTPSLVEPECALIQAEVWTGKILTLEGKRRDMRSNAPYVLIFENLQEAEGFAEMRVEESPDVECHILDHNGQEVRRVVKKGHKRTISPPHYEWWKFWRWRFW